MIQALVKIFHGVTIMMERKKTAINKGGYGQFAQGSWVMRNIKKKHHFALIMQDDFPLVQKIFRVQAPFFPKKEGCVEIRSVSGGAWQTLFSLNFLARESNIYTLPQKDIKKFFKPPLVKKGAGLIAILRFIQSTKTKGPIHHSSQPCNKIFKQKVSFQFTCI